MTKKQPYEPELVQRFLQQDYHDRGMIKWQGFYLSDHTSVMAKQAQAAQIKRSQHHNAPQDQATITETLNDAIVKQRTVMVDRAERSATGLIPAPITGKVAGWFGSQIVIGTQLIEIADIYAIKLIM